MNNLNRSIGPASCRKANYFGGDQLVLGAAINLEFGDLGRLDFDLVMGSGGCKGGAGGSSPPKTNNYTQITVAKTLIHH